MARNSGLCLSPLPASLSTVCSPQHHTHHIHDSWVQNIHSVKLKHTDKMLWNEVLVTQSCPTLCNPMDCSPPDPAVHGILQERILAWVAIPFSRGSSWPRDLTRMSCIADSLQSELPGKPINAIHLKKWNFYGKKMWPVICRKFRIYRFAMEEK